MPIDDAVLKTFSRLSEVEFEVRQATRQGERIEKSLQKLHDEALETELEGIFGRIRTKIFRFMVLLILIVLLAGVWRLNKRLERFSGHATQVEPTRP